MKPLMILTAMTVIGIIGMVGAIENADAGHYGRPDPPDVVGTYNILNCTTLIGNINSDKDVSYITPIFSYGGYRLTADNYEQNGGYIFPYKTTEHTKFFNFTHTIKLDDRFHTEQWRTERVGLDIHFQWKYITNHNTNATNSYPDRMNIDDLKGTPIVIDYSTEHNQLCFFYENEAPPEPPTIPKTRLQLVNEKVETLETKVDRKTDTKNKWKERFNTCFDKKEKFKTELSELQSSNTDLESRFNILQSNFDESQQELSIYKQNLTNANFEIDKLKQEKADLIKKVETLETQLQEN